MTRIEDSEIASVHIFLPVNYTLNVSIKRDNVLYSYTPTVSFFKENCPLRMQSAIIFQYYFHEKDLTDLHITADLGLHQSNAIYCHKDYFHNYDTPIIGSEGGSQEFELESILDRYLERNCEY